MIISYSISYPDDILPQEKSWVLKLRRDNKVFLPKENIYASVEWPYEYGHFEYGQIGLNISGSTHRWSMNDNGEGFNYEALILPVKNNLAKNPELIPVSDVRRLERMISKLEKKIQYLTIIK